jgi:hypothetical protein
MKVNDAKNKILHAGTKRHRLKILRKDKNKEVDRVRVHRQKKN